MTHAGGIDLPGEIAGVVALDELVVPPGGTWHAASRQPYDVDESSLAAVHGFVEQFSTRRGSAVGSSVRSSRCRTTRRSSTGPSVSPVATPKLVAGLSYSSVVVSTISRLHGQ